MAQLLAAHPGGRLEETTTLYEDGSNAGDQGTDPDGNSSFLSFRVVLLEHESL